MGTVLTATPANAATPLASASVIVSRPPVDSLLSLCVTSHTLDPSGICLTLGSLAPPAVTGTMTGAVNFDNFAANGGAADVALAFTGLIGGPGLTANFLGYPGSIPIALGASVSTPFPFAYQGTDGTGTCTAMQTTSSNENLGGINWTLGNPAPMWGQLQCTGTFAGHSGPFNVDFAGTASFVPGSGSTGKESLDNVNLQGGWAVVFGT